MGEHQKGFWNQDLQCLLFSLCLCLGNRLCNSGCLADKPSEAFREKPSMTLGIAHILSI